MRRPKILGAAIVAMATATMFSSCIETDEPAGIEKLRTAKVSSSLLKLLTRQQR